MILWILTAILFLLKVLGYADISWWIVAAPALVAIGLFVVFGGILTTLWYWANK
jgi:hypothetical protein